MYHKIQDFIQEWAHESQSTLKYLDTLTDESLRYKTGGGVREIGRLAWHIVNSPALLNQAGLNVASAPHDSQPPATAREFAETFRKASESVIAEVQKWKDEDLAKEANMFGQTWRHGQTLNVMIKHMIHHRGQLSILMREAGLKVPGIYGPSREEWTERGMPEMA